MKASLKFRDEQTPLFRAKLPLNVLSFPFQSGVVAGNSKELSLQLSTFFHSGPSLKLAYKPNDVSNPFTFVVKTGTGKYGSPIDCSMVMSAEFNLVGHGGNPSFFVHFKPRFGDFGIWKKQSSVFTENKEEDSSIEVIKKPKMDRGYMPESFEFPGMNKIRSSPSISRMLSGVEMSAATLLPVMNLANVKIQWGLRFPAEIQNMLYNKDGLIMNKQPTVSFQKIPFLVMNKISVEHGRGRIGDEMGRRDSLVPDEAGKDDVSIMCHGVEHQLEVLHNENELLRKAVEDLRSEISCGKMNPFAGEMKPREAGRGVWKKTTDSKAESRLVDHANEEVKKKH